MLVLGVFFCLAHVCVCVRVYVGTCAFVRVPVRTCIYIYIYIQVYCLYNKQYNKQYVVLWLPRVCV